MAIEFREKTVCEECKAREMAGVVYLPLSPGERDVLRDILGHVKEQHARGMVDMSAMDLADFQRLLGEVEDL